MKQALRAVLINSIAIALAALFLPGIKYGHQLSTLVIAATVLGIANTFIKPVLSLVLLPLNIITLGILGFFMNSILLLIVTLLVPNFDVVPFTFLWAQSTIRVSLFVSYLISSFVLSSISSLIRRVLE